MRDYEEIQLRYMDECMSEDGFIFGMLINFDVPYSNGCFVKFDDKQKMLKWINNALDDLRQVVPVERIDTLIRAFPQFEVLF